MAKVSRKAHTIQALIMLGAVEQSTSSKYRVFDTRSQRFFVGHSGALHLGSRGDLPYKSQSITNTPAHRHLATLGEFAANIANPREVYQHIRVTS